MRQIHYNNETLRIYENMDITDETIKKIANLVIFKGHEKRELKNRKDFKGKKTVTYYYKEFMTLDTETTTTFISNRQEEQGFIYLVQLKILHYTIVFRKPCELVNFLEKLGESLNDKIKLVVYVHNLSYEFQFLKDYLKSGYYEKVFATKTRQILTLDTTHFEFRDSYKFTNMNLENFTKKYCKKYIKLKEIMDYDILRTPNTYIDDNTLLYSVLDVLSLHEALCCYMQNNDVKISDNYPTSTSLVRRELREKMLPELDEKTKDKTRRRFLRESLTVEQYKILEDVKAGGNTHANRIHTGKVLYNVGHCDITSSYPHVMICYNEFSKGQFSEEHYFYDENGIIDIEKLYRLSLKRVIILQLNIINIRIKDSIPIPCLSISRTKGFKEEKGNNDNGRVLWSKGTLKTTMYALEFFKCFLKQYDFDDIRCTYSISSDKDYLPLELRQSIYHFFENKSKLKGTGQDYLYMKSKNMVNGIYGCCYTNPVHDNIYMEDCELKKQSIFDGLTESEKELLLSDSEKITKLLDNNIKKSLESYYKNKNNFLSYQWGSQVAMLGRVSLQEIIDIIPANDVIYCDTDSVFYLNKEINEKKVRELSENRKKEYEERIKNDDKNYVSSTAIKSNGKESTLGTIDIEDDALEFKTFGAKKYCQKLLNKDGSFRFEITIAGVPKTKGSEQIKSMDDFVEGKIFGEEVGKLEHRYNDIKEPFFETVDGCLIEFRSNIALRKTTYTLSMTDNYKNVIENILID